MAFPLHVLLPSLFVEQFQFPVLNFYYDPLQVLRRSRRVVLLLCLSLCFLVLSVSTSFTCSSIFAKSFSLVSAGLLSGLALAFLSSSCCCMGSSSGSLPLSFVVCGFCFFVFFCFRYFSSCFSIFIMYCFFLK